MYPESFPLFWFLLLIATAAFFSATETALFSLTRFQLRQIKQKAPETFSRIRHLLDRPAALVATVLLGNELANVITSRMMANFYRSHGLSSAQVTIFNLLTVLPIIMIFGEITPKIMGAKSSLSVINTFSTPFWFFYKTSFPVRFLLETVVNLLTKGLRRRSPKKEEQIKEEDIRLLLEDGKKKGAIHSVEQDIIENLFEIDDDKVIELATPIKQCFTVDQDENPKTVIEKLNGDFYARIPVREGTHDRIVGILYAKDLLSFINRDEQEMTVKNLMKDPLVVEPNMKVEVLFRRFRQLKRHIAVIEDKDGKALAVITMEDILAQMFGELWEESR